MGNGWGDAPYEVKSPATTKPEVTTMASGVLSKAYDYDDDSDTKSITAEAAPYNPSPAARVAFVSIARNKKSVPAATYDEKNGELLDSKDVGFPVTATCDGKDDKPSIPRKSQLPDVATYDENDGKPSVSHGFQLPVSQNCDGNTDEPFVYRNIQSPSNASVASKESSVLHLDEALIGPTREDLIFFADHLLLTLNSIEQRSILKFDQVKQAKLAKELLESFNKPESTLYREVTICLSLAVILCYQHTEDGSETHGKYLKQSDLFITKGQGIIEKVETYGQTQGLKRKDMHAWSSLRARVCHVRHMITISDGFKQKKNVNLPLIDAFTAAHDVKDEVEVDRKNDDPWSWSLSWHNMKDAVDQALEITSAIGFHKLNCICDGCAHFTEALPEAEGSCAVAASGGNEDETKDSDNGKAGQADTINGLRRVWNYASQEIDEIAAKNYTDYIRAIIDPAIKQQLPSISADELAELTFKTTQAFLDMEDEVLAKTISEPIYIQAKIWEVFHLMNTTLPRPTEKALGKRKDILPQSSNENSEEVSNSYGLQSTISNDARPSAIHVGQLLNDNNGAATNDQIAQFSLNNNAQVTSEVSGKSFIDTWSEETNKFVQQSTIDFHEPSFFGDTSNVEQTLVALTAAEGKKLLYEIMHIRIKLLRPEICNDMTNYLVQHYSNETLLKMLESPDNFVSIFNHLTSAYAQAEPARVSIPFRAPLALSQDLVLKDLLQRAVSPAHRDQIVRDYFVRRVNEFQDGVVSEKMIKFYLSWTNEELIAFFGNRFRFVDVITSLSWQMADSVDGEDTLGLF